MATDYEIKRDEKTGKQICKFKFAWVDKNGKHQVIETDDLEAAQTVIDLLSGEVCLSDLEP
jgi:hypothetical protein